MNKLFTAFAAITIFTASALARATEIQGPIQKAHEAYLKNDGKTLALAVKAGLELAKNQGPVKKNLLGLFSAAEKNGLLQNIEPNWILPKEITYASFESHRRYKLENGKVSFFLAVSMGVAPDQELEQLQVIRFPDQVILDKAANIGNWNITTNSRETNFWAGTDQKVTQNEEGLYLINLKIKGQPMVQAWLILADKNSSSSPVVTEPALKQIFTTNQPVFKWRKFVSPEFKQNEASRISIRVTKTDSEETEVSQVRLKDSKATSLKFGDSNAVVEVNGPDQLSTGDYYFNIAYREVENFGGFQIRRTSSTKVPFSVKY